MLSGVLPDLSPILCSSDRQWMDFCDLVTSFSSQWEINIQQWLITNSIRKASTLQPNISFSTSIIILSFVEAYKNPCEDIFRSYFKCHRSQSLFRAISHREFYLLSNRPTFWRDLRELICKLFIDVSIEPYQIDLLPRWEDDTRCLFWEFNEK